MRYRHSLFVRNQEAVDLAVSDIKDQIGEKYVKDLSVIDGGVTKFIEVRFYTEKPLSEYTIHALTQIVRPEVTEMNNEDDE